MILILIQKAICPAVSQTLESTTQLINLMTVSSWKIIFQLFILTVEVFMQVLIKFVNTRTYSSQFTVIALSKTWMNEDRGVEFDLEGFNFFYTSRVKNRGWGVALFVKSALRCGPAKSMSVIYDDVLESIAVQLR